jgi:hypothetical protein
MVAIEGNNVYKFGFVGFGMGLRLGKDDLSGRIRGTCDSVKRASKVKYSVCSRGKTAVALFRPVSEVKVLVCPYAGSCDSVDVVFRNGEVFGEYAGIVDIMGQVDGWRLYGGDRKVGLKWFRKESGGNLKSRTRVEVGMHIDSGGLDGALMFMFSNMMWREAALRVKKESEVLYKRAFLK